MQVRDMIPDFERTLNELEQLASQAGAHRKKFQFCVNQFRHFLTTFSQHAEDRPATPDELDAYKRTCLILEELNQLLCQHQIHCWAQITIESSCSFIASTLCDIATKFKESTSILDAEASSSFEDDSSNWVPFHILDLKGIAASFKMYIEKDGKEEVAQLMNMRLRSVDKFLQEFGDESHLTPGLRVFSPIPVNYQSWRVNYEEFEEKKEVGSGVSANVYYGIDKRTGNEVAIKRLKFKKLAGSRLQTFQREVAVLATATHPTLLGFVGATDKPPYCIVTDWMSNGTLYQELHQYKRLNPTKRTIAAFDIARGMEFLHSKHIIHRDLKSLNVLFDSNGFAHICDFGFSRKDDEDDLLTRNVGTPHWMAPELLSSGPYTSKVDVYAYGILLWEIVTSRLPYYGLDANQVTAQVLYSDLRPSIPANVVPAMKDLLRKCWAKNPDLRPTFSEILKEFRTGNIMLQGCNKGELMSYITEKLGDETVTVAMEKQLETGDGLKSLIENAEKGGLPHGVIDKFWSRIEACQDPELAARGAALVIHSPASTLLKRKAVALWRSLPPGSIKPELISATFQMIPSGMEEFDTDIVVAACKNGVADLMLMYVILPQHVKLLLEVVAQQGVDIGLKAAVADQCVKSLVSDDEELICSAIRCLVGIGESKRIPSHFLISKLQEPDLNPILANCLCVAVGAIAVSGQDIPAELADALLAKAQNGPIAANVLVAAAKTATTGLHIFDVLLKKQHVLDLDVVLKMLMVMARNSNRAVLPAVSDVAKKFDFSQSPKCREAYSALMKYLEANA